MSTSDFDRNQDLPSQDAPDDDAIVPGASEPDPADVVGDENPRDRAGHPIQDPNVRETLDERLSEEEPDRPQRPAAGDVQLLAGEDDESDGLSAEPDDDDADPDELGAEEAAIHIVDEP
jgi:hypothetical protein